MYNNKSVAVVVPAYNEEKQIGLVLSSIPDYVDRIIVVDDCSIDKTVEVVRRDIANSGINPTNINRKQVESIKSFYNKADLILAEINEKESKYFSEQHDTESSDKSRIVLIRHKINAGVGAAIASGYKWCKDNGIDCAAVMAGDAQMDPGELEQIIKPVLLEGIDYVKGNRLRHQSSWHIIPKTRFFGNSILSILTKIASGYWHVSDTQTGFTAISNAALNAIPLYKIYKRYGMPNDILVKLNIAFCTLKEVNIKPVYNVGEKSKMKLIKVIPGLSLLLIRCFFQRLWVKYLFKDFHPLFLLYHFAFLLGLACIPYAKKVIDAFITGTTLNYEPLLAFLFLFISGFQSFLFAMWMDIQDNERLYK
ncbi:MAG: glycosyltransferase family 2 protein [Melioribacteraceae bacterium]|nr:glycosyltransferase family 2 protein [Melioribacteraceae bacterium]